MAKLGRPTKPLISKENAIKFALEIIDEQGLEALSLERLAKRIGVRAPSLYHHFHNKAELLTEVARSILTHIEAPPEHEAADWEELLLNLCLATRRAILRHPRAGLLLLQYFPRSLLLSAYDHWTARCPYPVDVQMLILDGSEKITFGSAFFAAAADAYAIPAMPPFPAQRFPALALAVENNPLDEEQLFAETIRVFLAGLKARYGDRIPAAAPKRAATRAAATKTATTKAPKRKPAVTTLTRTRAKARA